MKNKYSIENDVIRVQINHKGAIVEALFDAEDLPLLNSFPNTLTIAKGYAVYGYREVKGGWVKYKGLHRLVTKCPEGLDVDHIHRNTLDNRKSELRIVTKAQNRQNQKLDKRNKYGAKNIYYVKGKNLYVVHIRVNGKIQYIGSSKDIEEAKVIALEGRKKYFPYSVNEST